MFVQFSLGAEEGITNVMLVNEEADKACSNAKGHDFSPENGARFGDNGNECLHCSHFAGIERFESLGDAIASTVGTGFNVATAEPMDADCNRMRIRFRKAL